MSNEADGCILCGGHEFRPVLEKEGYRIQTCRACGLTQLYPQPTAEELEAVYSSEAYFGGGTGERGYADYADQEVEYLATFRDDIARIGEFVPSGRVLDVGCGFGYFMQAAEEAGYEAWGCDLSAPAVERAERRFPGRVFEGRLDEISELADKKFDVIFASHLIEHVPDPVAFIRDLVGRLTPSGIFVAVTPNIGSLLSRVSRSRWVSFKVPEHVAFYRPETMTKLLRKGGLEPVAYDSAYQFYRLPFVAKRLRELTSPVSKAIPPVEKTRLLNERIVKVTSGSLRVIARRADV